MAICVAEGGEEPSNGFLQWGNFLKSGSLGSQWLGEIDKGWRTRKGSEAHDRHMSHTAPELEILSILKKKKKKEPNNLFFLIFSV